MNGRYPARDDRRAPARRSRPPEPRTGAHVGPLRITPARVTLLVALLGGLAFLAWAVVVRDQLQVPLMTSGFAIVGLAFAAAAAMAAASVVRAGREGRDGTAVATAVLGGLLAIAAFVSFAAAFIMALIWGGTTAT